MASSQTLSNSNVGHREPTAVEAAAGTDFVALQEQWEGATAELVDAWGDIQDIQIEELLDQIKSAVSANNVVDLANVSAPVLGEDLILEHMTSLAETAIAEAKREAKKQGRTIKAAVEDIAEELAARSEAIANLMANSLSGTASRQALLRYGTDPSATRVADGVGKLLEELSDTTLNDVLGGALTQAQNSGRRLVMSQEPDASIHASELLDQNTCEPCSQVDGTEYDDMADASGDYPAGGYAECLGGPRCRGTLVATYGEGN
jgi:hypothetical protein